MGSTIVNLAAPPAPHRTSDAVYITTEQWLPRSCLRR